MICPDCEQEVESLTRNGICKKCNTRLNQINYLNRKNNTNDKYIPLKELKKTNPAVYKRLMKRRGTSVISSKSESNTKKLLQEDVISVNRKEDDKLKSSVNEKLIRAWKEKDCYIDLGSNDINMYYIFLNILKEIVTGKFADDSAKILTMISVSDRYKSDMEHRIRHCDIETYEGLQDLITCSKELHFLENIRQDVKDIYDNRVSIMKVATALKESIGTDLIDNAIGELNKLEEFRKDPKYCPVVDYEMSEKYDWTYEQNINKPLYADSDKVKNAGAHLYLVSCPLIGYKKSQKPTEFTRRVYTTTEQIAISEWKDFVRNNLSGVRYNDSDIKVEIINK